MSFKDKVNGKKAMLFIYIFGLAVLFGYANIIDAWLIYVYLGFGMVLIVVFQMWFVTTNKRKLFMMKVDTSEVGVVFLGRIIGIPMPDEPVILQRNLFSNKLKVHFSGDIWKYIIMFRDTYGGVADCVVGRVEDVVVAGKKVKNERNFIATATKRSFKEIFSTKDVLEYATKVVSDDMDDRIKMFDVTTTSLMELGDKIQDVKNNVVVIARRLNSGMQDYFLLLKEVHGLDADEVNRRQADQLIAKARQRQHVLQMIKEGKIDPQTVDLKDILGDVGG
jgi:hypothetical protein